MEPFVVFVAYASTFRIIDRPPAISGTSVHNRYSERDLLLGYLHNPTTRLLSLCGPAGAHAARRSSTSTRAELPDHDCRLPRDCRCDPPRSSTRPLRPTAEPGSPGSPWGRSSCAYAGA